VEKNLFNHILYRRVDDSVVEEGMLFLGATNISDDRGTQERAALRVVRHQNFS